MRSKFKWIFTLLVAFSMQFSFAQEKTVRGVVSDSEGPLPGANVVIKGTTKGVTTDFDGNYSISAKAGDVLVVSFVGKKDALVTVGAANVYNVSLEDNVIVGSEVVGVGIIGVKRKIEAVTSSYDKVNAKVLTQATNPNVVQALQGKVTGMQINATNNGVNQTSKVVIRNARSITGDNGALVVIDNAISSLGFLQALAPEIVEDVTVLKGAQGAALYGEQGANGVIVVTTKKGSGGEKMKLSLSSSVTFEDVSYMAQRQERYGQGWSGTHVSYENGAWGAEFDGVMRPVGLAQADGSYIMSPYSPIKDNVKKFFQTGTLFQNNVSLSGGTLKTGYFGLSLNNQKTNFVVEKDRLNRTAVNLNGGKQIGNWTLTGTVNYINSKTNTTTSGILTELYQAATNIPVERFRNSGNEGAWTSYYRNPYWRLDNERFENGSDAFNSSFTVNYKINDHIDVNYLGNIVSTSSNAMNYVNEYVDNLQIGGGDHSTVSQFGQSNTTSRNFYGDLVLNFNYKLTDNLSYKANLGLNTQDAFARSTAVSGSNLTIPGFYNISNVEGIPTTSSSTARSRSIASFYNMDFGYKDVLFLNHTLRWEQISKLIGSSSGNNYLFPSVGVSFLPAKAFGFNSDDKIKDFKVYANITQVGNARAISAYDLNNLYVSGTGYPFGNLNSFVQSTSATDQAIRPELLTSSEIGVNLGMFKNRLTLDVSAFKSNTKDLITRVSASPTSGLSNLLGNVGELESKGFEIDLGFTPIDKKDFNDLGLRWENKIGYSTSKAIVNKVSDQADEVALQTGTEIGIFAVKGEQFPTIKGTAYERDDQGRVIIDATTGNPLKAEGLKILGTNNPKYIINYNTAVDFKGFRLAAVMDYRTGHKFWSGTKDWLAWSGHIYESAENGRTGFIFPNSSYESAPGVYSANTNIVTGGNSYASYLSYFQDEYATVAENFVLDATAFKVRELSLTYTMPTKFIEKAGLSNLSLGVNARNPFMVLPKENRGYSDPEFSNTSGNATGLSVVGQYPTTRTFAFTLNASF